MAAGGSEPDPRAAAAGDAKGWPVLAQGQRVGLRRSRLTWRVGRLLGEGGQGAVHELECVEEADRVLALKWYQPAAATARQRAAIETLVAHGSPGPVFLWPMELVDIEGQPGFGYVMPRCPSGQVGLTDLLRQRIDAPPSVAVKVCLGLADAFLTLHAQGLCYRDISFGNIMVDPANGAVSILDNDNVGVDRAGQSGVLGTRRFMAPEIIRGEDRPNAQTDLHSLAVLNFYVLMLHHPLIGRRELDYPCLDRDAENVLFGTEPVFVFDPNDPSNAPDPVEHAGVLANWAIHPLPIRRLFEQAFGAGLRDPLARVRESVWRAALARLVDSIATCPACGRENFRGDGVAPVCWACLTPLGDPVRLVFSGGELVLGARTTVCRHHLRRDYDYQTIFGEVTRHPTRDLWGLRNVCGSRWAAKAPGREATVVEPGQTLALVPGAEVEIDGARVRIVR